MRIKQRLKVLEHLKLQMKLNIIEAKLQLAKQSSPMHWQLSISKTFKKTVNVLFRRRLSRFSPYEIMYLESSNQIVGEIRSSLSIYSRVNQRFFGTYGHLRVCDLLDGQIFLITFASLADDSESDRVRTLESSDISDPSRQLIG